MTGESVLSGRPMSWDPRGRYLGQDTQQRRPDESQPHQSSGLGQVGGNRAADGSSQRWELMYPVILHLVTLRDLELELSCPCP